MFPRDFICILSTLLFLLFFYLTDATPTATTTNPLLFPPSNRTITVNEVMPYCFSHDSHPGIGTTNSHDCRETLRMIYRDPNRENIYRFTKNPRRDVGVLGLPYGWQYNECVIYVSCSNERDAAYLKFLDVAQQAVKVIRACVDQKDTKYGGIEEIGSVSTFYVSVGRPTNPRRVSSSLSASLAQATLVGNSTLVEAALSDIYGDDSGFAAES